MKTLSLVISYIGKNYNGWNNKNNKNNTCIKYHIKKITKKITKKKFIISVSSRTDSGVNAKKQNISLTFKENLKIKKKTIKKEFNKNLPNDIKIKKIKNMPKEFNSKIHSICKKYQYKIITNKENIFNIKNYWLIKEKININKLNELSKYILGENNFENFRSIKCNFKNAIRLIWNIKIRKKKNLIKIKIIGNAFCYKMIRIIVGILIKASIEKKNKKNNKNIKTIAPALGLSLNKIYFSNNIKKIKIKRNLILPRFPINNILL